MMLAGQSKLHLRARGGEDRQVHVGKQMACIEALTNTFVDVYSGGGAFIYAVQSPVSSFYIVRCITPYRPYLPVLSIISPLPSARNLALALKVQQCLVMRILCIGLPL